MMFNSPLRYPGGKGRLSGFMANVVERNDLGGGNYVEPYAGGAGIGITLLFLEYVRAIHLNDIDRAVYAFWWSVLNETEVLCQRIRDTKPTVREWKRQRAVQDTDDIDLLSLGFSTFFLNRTNRSGIIRGGLIGGLKQDGPYLLDARYNRRDLVERIQKIAAFSSRIHIYNKDAAHFLRKTLPRIPYNSLIYLDPPYYVKGADLYENHYSVADHAKIADQLQTSITQKWLVSYDNVAPVRKLYAARRQKTFGIHYSAGDHAEGSEVMILCDELKVPKSISPSRGLIG